MPSSSAVAFWVAWGFFALGLVLTFLWGRACLSLWRAWSDPSAKVLRFSSLAVLLLFAMMTYSFLLAPFR